MIGIGFLCTASIAEIIIAVATCITAVATAIIGWFTIAKNVKSSKEAMYASTVSIARLDWIEHVRAAVSNLAAFCAVHKELDENCAGEYEKLRVAVLMDISSPTKVKKFSGIDGGKAAEYYDYDGTLKTTDAKGRYAFDGEIMGILSSDYAVVRSKIKDLVLILTEICNKEWESVKAEAGGMSYQQVYKRHQAYDKSVNIDGSADSSAPEK